MFPIPEKPGDKVCTQCGEVVTPEWATTVFEGLSGWVGVSVCGQCGHRMIHFSGPPQFVFAMHERAQEDGIVSPDLR